MTRPAHHDCPPCPDRRCSPTPDSGVGVGIAALAGLRRADPEHRLYCPACGVTWRGTDTEVEQAARADAAWAATP